MTLSYLPRVDFILATVELYDWGTTTRGDEPATSNYMEAKQNTTEPQEQKLDLVITTRFHSAQP